MRTLRVYESKVTYRKAFTVSLFPLESEKKSKNYERSSFENVQGLVTCLLTHRRQMPHISGFLDCFSLAIFWTLLVALQLKTIYLLILLFLKTRKRFLQVIFESNK